jgi:hypothetical protein
MSTGQYARFARRCNRPGCGRQILLVTTARNKTMPVDVLENDEGRIAVYRNASGGLVGRALGKDEEPKPYERLYITHFATGVPYLEQQARAKAEREAARAGR